MPISNPASGWPTTFLQLSDTPGSYAGHGDKRVAVNAAPNALEFETAVTSGSYVGNDTTSRAIPHGLGVTPKLVLIHTTSRVNWFRIIDGIGKIFEMSTEAWTATVTAMDDTNFYVGKSIDFIKSANGSGITHNWVAIG
ncbi:unnamed protein product [marine sediment metagenome]|uniref:Uncharacterized protein n=1 Tax=marine sediment metagenome TaxID=412755 RepID=X1K9L2_9ZZZZ